MGAEDGRPLIDERGRLFGVVNIVDALVVFFVVVIVIGGVWFVAASEPEANGNSDGGSNSDGGAETDVRYATLDLGTVSPQVASQLEVGETIQRGPNSNLTITDLHQMPADDDIRVFARVELEGLVTETETGERFVYAEGPPRIDRKLALETDRYATSGRIQSVSEEDSELDRIDVQTVLEITNLSSQALEEMSVGDEYTISGETVGTIETIEAYGTGNPTVRRALIGITYRTVEPPAGVQLVFGTTTIREGSTLPFERETYTIEGSVRRLGALEPRGEVRNQTVTLELEGVSEQRAEQFEAGMSERVAGTKLAELTDVSVSEPNEEGERTVTMTATLRVRETAAGPQFKAESLRVDETITLEFEDTSADVTVLQR